VRGEGEAEAEEWWNEKMRNYQLGTGSLLHYLQAGIYLPFPTPDSRLPIPDSQLPIPDSQLPILTPACNVEHIGYPKGCTSYEYDRATPTRCGTRE
jgi:hypothetical protein